MKLGRLTGPALAAGLLLAAAADARQSPELPPLNPVQVEAVNRPLPGTRNHPNTAFVKRVEGWATVLCRVGRGGNLEACKAEDEEPAGWGFGEAAVKVAEREVRLGLKDRNGQPTAGRLFRFTRQFFLPGAQPKTPMPPPRGELGEDGYRHVLISTPNAAAMLRCFGSLPAGHYVVACKTRVDDTLAECVTVESSQADDPRQAAAAACSVQTARVRVTDPQGRPVAGVEVRLPVTWRK